jgi:peptidoglycan hydrolase CwlO-like protein
MEKNKLLTIMVIGLMLTNLMLLIVMFGKEPHQPPRKMPREVIIEKLRFNENQISKYDVLITSHRSKINSADMHLRNLKNELYQLLNSDKDITLERDSLIAEINNIQKEIEYIHFEHFMDIQNLCNDAQKRKFDELSKNLARLFEPPPPPKN